jgi:hypothetical protein
MRQTEYDAALSEFLRKDGRDPLPDSLRRTETWPKAIGPHCAVARMNANPPGSKNWLVPELANWQSGSAPQ